ncbi:MAG: hypothetical protein HY042_03900 [Spirochaetia bacterium]|nr:hypothetical protein [Spirochaetia bacterium]
MADADRFSTGNAEWKPLIGLIPRAVGIIGRFAAFSLLVFILMTFTSITVVFFWRLLTWVTGMDAPFPAFTSRPNLFETIGGVSAALLVPLFARFTLEKFREVTRKTVTYEGFVSSRGQQVFEGEVTTAKDFRIAAGGRTWSVPQSAWTSLTSGCAFRIHYDPVTGETFQIYVK